MSKLIFAILLFGYAIVASPQNPSAKVSFASKSEVLQLYLKVENSSDIERTLKTCGEEYKTPLLCNIGTKLEIQSHGLWTAVPIRSGNMTLILQDGVPYPLSAHGSGTFLVHLDPLRIDAKTGDRMRLLIPIENNRMPGMPSPQPTYMAAEFTFP